ncbi:MAG TPA: hypothetical protein VFV30_11330 [Novosphingobium sp.]|nr:hypothetical protein [Novosphingobium sp.]
MATVTANGAAAQGMDLRFYVKLAWAMALVMVAGFSMQLAMGRSSFSAPPRVHFHAVIFFGWIVLFLGQAHFAAAGNRARHAMLGRVAMSWIVLMLTAGLAVTIALAREGRVPFFFYPQQFVVGDPLSLFTFVGLTAWAVSRRGDPEWHVRLQICALAAITGPGFGRLLPMPLIAPYGFEAAGLAGLVFPLAGLIRDRRLGLPAHPAWLWGMAAIVAMIAGMDLIAYSPLGDAIYAAMTAGSPGAAVPGLALPPPPPM